MVLHYLGGAGLRDFGEAPSDHEDEERAGGPPGVDSIIGWHIAGSPFPLSVAPPADTGPAGPLARVHPYAIPPAPPCSDVGGADSGRWVRRGALEALARSGGTVAAAAAAAGEDGVGESDDGYVWVPWGCRRRRFRDAADVRACLAPETRGAEGGEDDVPRVLIVGSSQQVPARRPSAPSYPSGLGDATDEAQTGPSDGSAARHGCTRPADTDKMRTREASRPEAI